MKRKKAPEGFYPRVMSCAVPIMIQNGISMLVGMLDNIMVGQIGTDAMSGVSIVNQLLFVYDLCIFGGYSGIGIFTAQFWGKKDMEGMRYTLRAKVLLGTILTTLCIILLACSSTRLISLFLHEGGSAGNIAVTLENADTYCKVMLWGLPASAMAYVYSFTLRESGETMVPMKAGIAAVFVNLIGNYLLIYGKLGCPALGTAGAAIATVISRFVEMGIVILWTHSHKKEYPFIEKCYASLHIPSDLLKQFAIKGTPLLLNETLWSSGMTVLMQCYSVRGLSTVAALNIANTLSNVFNVVFLAMGNATAILLGQELGAGHFDTIRAFANKLIWFSVFLSCLSAAAMFSTAPFFPRIYNTDPDVMVLAKDFLWISSLLMPMNAFNNCCYFTLRSGGKTFITFLFDCCFSWVVLVPAAFVLSRFTSIPAVPMYFIVQSLEILKSFIGFALVRKGTWIHDLTSYQA